MNPATLINGAILAIFCFWLPLGIVLWAIFR